MDTATALPQTAAPITDRRVALVVGNSRYRNVPALANPANDANLMAKTLKKLGFTLISGRAEIDLDKQQFDRAIQTFGHQLPGSSIALFFYAGKGFQVDGKYYLVPVSAKLNHDKSDLEIEMVDAQTILNQMDTGDDKRLNVVAIDASRNNPFPSTGEGGLRSNAGGLGQRQAPNNTLISYSTAPGGVAFDDSGKDSPYTEAVAQAIQKPGANILDVFQEVGVIVEKETGGAQQPWLSSSPTKGSFYFVPDSVNR